MDLIAVEGAAASAAAGAIVWWRLSGDAPFAPLSAALAGLGITPPGAPTPESALRRALPRSGASRGDRMLARRMDDRGRRLAVVRETADAAQDDLTYNVEIRATLEKVTQSDGTSHTVLCTVPHTAAIHAAYDAALDALTADDVGLWLVRKAIDACDGVSLRDTGGVYFIPSHGLQRWRAIGAAVAAHAAHRFFHVPCFNGDDAVDGILDALSQSVEGSLAAIERAADEGLGERAAATQRARVEALRARVARYEGILGAGAAHLHAACDRLAAHSAFGTLAGMGDALSDPLADLSF